MKLRMTVTTDYVEKDSPGAERRKTIGLELVGGDDRDDNAAIKATSAELKLHGVHALGFLPFNEGGDYYVTIEKAPPVIVPEPPKEEEAKAEAKPSK